MKIFRTNQYRNIIIDNDFILEQNYNSKIKDFKKFYKIININKKKVNNISKIKTFRKELLYYLILLILPLFIVNREINYNDSNITLKINKKGSAKIYNDKTNCFDSYAIYPNKMIINGLQLDFNSHYDFQQENNNITLIWDNPLYDAHCMFSDCPDIIEIDFSNFESSHLNDFGGMFWGCLSLKYINFSNFNTSQVTRMSNMFNNCTSLESLDLSIFNTSKVIQISDMFKGCIKLKSLDISNFDTSNVENMNNVFYGCSSLEFINLGNKTINEKLYDSISNLITNIISNNEAQKLAYINGKTNLFDFFVGQVMKNTRGKANPTLTKEILNKKLN